MIITPIDSRKNGSPNPQNHLTNRSPHPANHTSTVGAPCQQKEWQDRDVLEELRGKTREPQSK